MGCGSNSVLSVVTYVAAVLATLAGIAMLVILPTQLEDVSVNASFMDLFPGSKSDDASSNNTSSSNSFIPFLNFTSSADPDAPFIQEAQCLLGSDSNNNSLCVYLYVVIGVSLAASLAASLIQCITCNLFGFGRYLDLILSVCAMVWYAIAAVIITQGAMIANKEQVPNEDYRNAVVGLLWLEVVLFGLIVSTGVVYCTGRCAGQRYIKVEDVIAAP